MQYFLMKENIKYVNRPIIINWLNKVNLQQIHQGNYEHIPKRMILEVKPNINIEFVDIISVPFLLVSQKIKKVLELYEPNMTFKEIILLDKKNGHVGEYVLPLLKEKNILSTKSVFTNYHTVLQKMILEKSKLDDTAVFFVKGAPREAGVWRLDIIEAILLREVQGFTLEPVEID